MASSSHCAPVPGIEGLYRIGRADDLKNFDIPVQEQCELVPRVLPQLYRGRVFASPFLGELVESQAYSIHFSSTAISMTCLVSRPSKPPGPNRSNAICSRPDCSVCTVMPCIMPSMTLVPPANPHGPAGQDIFTRRSTDSPQVTARVMLRRFWSR